MHFVSSKYVGVIGAVNNSNKFFARLPGGVGATVHVLRDCVTYVGAQQCCFGLPEVSNLPLLGIAMYLHLARRCDHIYRPYALGDGLYPTADLKYGVEDA